MAKLVVKAGRNAGSEFKLNGDRFVMGRRSQCPIPIADPKASREHAVVTCKEDKLFLQDLSRNGTLLNGMPASKAEHGSPLKYGDQIKIGDTVLEVVDEKAEPIDIDIPGYQILEKCGSGGMGVVYKAKQLSMDRIVALKVLNERYSVNNEFVDRFIREARAAGKLNHPNVIHVHDISRANGRHYFSMEFIDGSSIKELLRAEKKIGYDKALDIILQCAKALEFAHENNIVHRDVKPDNIMVTRESIVKIADLGIAKTFEEAAPSAKEHRRVMGTPHYMAPEQALGKTIDHRVDIYSLGATFYHMLTGTTPFSGSTAHEILKAHIQESLPAIQELNPEVPDPVCFVIERMMAKLPEKRYANMSKVIEDIERVQSGVVAGIDRIEAGDSTIMRAVSSQDAPGTGLTEEVTGTQTPIARMGLALVLTAIFAATVAGVVIFPQRMSRNNEAVQAPKPPAEVESPAPPAAPVPPPDRSNPQAKTLLQAAISAQAASDPAAYEKNLLEIQTKYPASIEAEEATKRLADFTSAKKEAEKQKAETALAEARKFEAANPANLAECINKYRAVMAVAQSQPAVLDAAKNALDALKKKQDDESARGLEAAYKTASDAAAESRGKGDFDAARKTLQDFMNQYAAAPQKATAQQAIDKVNADAQARFKEAQDAVAGLDLGAALAKWDEYTEKVKDANTANDVSTARQQLEAKAEQYAMEELTKSSAAARKYDYGEALKVVAALHKKVNGMKWAAVAKSKEEDVKRQKDLYEKFMGTLAKAVESEPAALPFPVEPRFGDVKWKVIKVEGETLILAPIVRDAAPELRKHLRDLAPAEQYKLHTHFLPKKLSIDEHKALSAFCMERGLAKEAQTHDQKAAVPPPTP